MPGVVESECYGKERSGRTRGRSGAGIHSLRCRGLVASIEPRGDYLGLAEHVARLRDGNRLHDRRRGVAFCGRCSHECRESPFYGVRRPDQCAFVSRWDGSAGHSAFSPDTLARECILYGQEPGRHALRLLAHGMAHLAGLDHGPDMDRRCESCVAAAQKMLAAEASGRGLCGFEDVAPVT